MAKDAEYYRKWRAARGARTGQPGRPVTAPCGTRSAYMRHLNRNETPCQACKDANSAHQREYYAARKAAKQES